MRLTNVHVRRGGGGPQEVHIGGGGLVRLERCTFENLSLQASPISEVDASHCLVTGDPKPGVVIGKGVTWMGSGNVYDLSSLHVDQASFRADTFAEFQKLTGSEAESQWSAEHPKAGADAEALRAALHYRIPR